MTVACFFVVAACAPGNLKRIKSEIDEEITYEAVIMTPEAVVDKLVLWGGVIIGAKNTKDGTMLEILQKPIDMETRPRNVDQSDGRFLALHDGYLDVAIYAEGREVTVAGTIKGKKTLPLGEIEYDYPLIATREVYLWPERKREFFYPPPHWYYPGWYRYPHYGYW
jgi:outer membrane lipoprotein